MSAQTNNNNSQTTKIPVTEDAPVTRSSYEWMNAERQQYTDASIVTKAQFEAMLDHAQMRETMRKIEEQAAPEWQKIPAAQARQETEAEAKYQQELLEALRVSQERWRLAQEMEEMQIYAATQLSLAQTCKPPP